MTRQTVNDDEGKCKTCNQTYGWHQEHQPIHLYNTGQLGATAIFKKPEKEEPVKPRQSAWPMDPVLRVALINKGVITPNDLRQAEEVIKMTTAQFEASVKESRNGESAEETRGRQVQE